MDPYCGIPVAVRAVQGPAPIGGKRQEKIDGAPKGARQMGDAGIAADDPIQTCDDCGRFGPTGEVRTKIDEMIVRDGAFVGCHRLL